MNLFRIVLVLAILVVVVLVLLKVLVPFVRRVLGRPEDHVVVPGSVVPDGTPPGAFPIAARHGYDPADVDELFDRVYELADTPSGRAEALELLRSARFHLARRDGYEPVFVDDRMDAVADALANGRDLPPRPDYR